jgi:fatty acid synthase
VLDITIKITRGSGTFEVEQGGSALVTGRIYCPEDINTELINIPPPQVESTSPTLSTKDVYKELKLRGYNYSGIFKAIRELDSTGKYKQIREYKTCLITLFHRQVWLENFIGMIIT